ncbi:MAG: phosphoribosylanthranilate isomerase [Nanoarchaeota archaeon]|nr:phosphoribosylanthranilate isomerase [Nanoarchaeota archaeon]
MTKIKICGITNLEDAEYCEEHEVDFLGFIFYKESKRYINKKDAQAIISKIKKPCVGVFADENIDKAIEIAKYCDLDIVQLHGNENNVYIRTIQKAMPNIKIIKALRVNDRLPLIDFVSDFLLFDTYSEKNIGGSGKSFDHRLLKNVSKPFFLAGGLNQSNISDAIHYLNPFAVDINSGVEHYPGKKDHAKIIKIIEIIRKIERSK